MPYTDMHTYTNTQEHRHLHACIFTEENTWADMEQLWTEQTHNHWCTLNTACCTQAHTQSYTDIAGEKERGRERERE